MINEKAEVSGGETVDTVGMHHVFKKLCSRKQIALKLSRSQEL